MYLLTLSIGQNDEPLLLVEEPLTSSYFFFLSPKPLSLPSSGKGATPLGISCNPCIVDPLSDISHFIPPPIPWPIKWMILYAYNMVSRKIPVKQETQQLSAST